MKISPKDAPKALLLVVLIFAVLVWIGMTALGQHKDATATKVTPPTSIVAGNPSTTAALEPDASPEQYIRQLDAWSKPPPAPMGDPFREVLPRDIVNSMNAQRSHTPPPTQISGNTLGGTNSPVNPLPSGNVNFPVVEVQGVVVDRSYGYPANFATLKVADKTVYARAGDVIANDMVVEQVTQLGVTIRAAKEHAFIEVSKSYQPNGMAPPAPPKPAVKRKHYSKHAK